MAGGDAPLPESPSPPRLTGVDGVGEFAGGAAVDAVALDQAHEQGLGQHDGDDGLRVHKVGVAQVVQAALSKDTGASVEPGHVVGAVQQLCG